MSLSSSSSSLSSLAATSASLSRLATSPPLSTTATSVPCYPMSPPLPVSLADQPSYPFIVDISTTSKPGEETLLIRASSIADRRVLNYVISSTQAKLGSTKQRMIAKHFRNLSPKTPPAHTKSVKTSIGWISAMLLHTKAKESPSIGWYELPAKELSPCPPPSEIYTRGKASDTYNHAIWSTSDSRCLATMPREATLSDLEQWIRLRLTLMNWWIQHVAFLPRNDADSVKWHNAPGGLRKFVHLLTPQDVVADGCSHMMLRVAIRAAPGLVDDRIIGVVHDWIRPFERWLMRLRYLTSLRLKLSDNTAITNQPVPLHNVHAFADHLYEHSHMDWTSREFKALAATPDARCIADSPPTIRGLTDPRTEAALELWFGVADATQRVREETPVDLYTFESMLPEVAKRGCYLYKGFAILPCASVSPDPAVKKAQRTLVDAWFDDVLNGSNSDTPALFAPSSSTSRAQERKQCDPRIAALCRPYWAMLQSLGKIESPWRQSRTGCHQSRQLPIVTILETMPPCIAQMHARYIKHRRRWDYLVYMMYAGASAKQLIEFMEPPFIATKGKAGWPAEAREIERVFRLPDKFSKVRACSTMITDGACPIANARMTPYHTRVTCMRSCMGKRGRGLPADGRIQRNPLELLDRIIDIEDLCKVGTKAKQLPLPAV